MIFTMGFTQKNAKQFFELVRKNEIELLVDIRLNNKSQLAGFTKGPDLEYFLQEICSCKYSHELDFAPTKDILDDYKKEKITWAEYEVKYNALLEKRRAAYIFEKKYIKFQKVLFLCSEPTPEQCHRRLLAEYLSSKFNNIPIKHI